MGKNWGTTGSGGDKKKLIHVSCKEKHVCFMWYNNHILLYPRLFPIIQVVQTRRRYLTVLEKWGLRVSVVHLTCHVHLETRLLWCSLYEPSCAHDELNAVKEEAFYLRRSLGEGIVWERCLLRQCLGEKLEFFESMADGVTLMIFFFS